MGSLPGSNGEQPPGGGGSSDGMPDVPPEWGRIVVPDDASALNDEAVVVRREMRRDIRRYRWRRRLRWSAPGTRDTPSLGVPLAIMAIAVVATLISLFAVAWPGGYNQRSPNAPGVTTQARPLTLPDLTLSDDDGVPVRIRDAAPAVVILVDGCLCDRVVADTAAAVDPRVSVLVVETPDPFASASPGASASGSPAAPGASKAPGASGAPASPGPTVSGTTGAAASGRPPGGPGVRTSGSPSRIGPSGVRVRTLLDPKGTLRAAVPGLPSTGRTGTILLVSAEWAVVRVVPATLPVTELKPDLDRLAG